MPSLDCFSHPLIVVCIPVFNEKNYVLETLASVQNQTMRDFLCVVRDNCSTDGTDVICRKFALNDARFVYTQSDYNGGAAANWNALRDLTRSKFIAWIGGHDKLRQNFLQESINTLIADETISLCFSNVEWINENNVFIRETNGGNFVLNSRDPLERFVKTAINIRGECTAINGVIRRSALNRIVRLPSFDGADHFILSHLQFSGKFSRRPAVLYERRLIQDPQQSYQERLRGKQRTQSTKINMWPLVVAQLTHFLKLPTSPQQKLSKFPTLLFGLLERYKKELYGISPIHRVYRVILNALLPNQHS